MVKDNKINFDVMIERYVLREWDKRKKKKKGHKKKRKEDFRVFLVWEKLNKYLMNLKN